MDNVECPYCGKETEICHDDGAGFQEDILEETSCEHCDKSFVYDTYISYSYTGYKADCLNGEEHKYAPTNTYPIEYTKWRCADCGKEILMTPSELTNFIRSKM